MSTQNIQIEITGRKRRGGRKKRERRGKKVAQIKAKKLAQQNILNMLHYA